MPCIAHHTWRMSGSTMPLSTSAEVRVSSPQDVVGCIRRRPRCATLFRSMSISGYRLDERMAAGRIAHQADPNSWIADRERSRALEEMYLEFGDHTCIICHAACVACVAECFCLLLRSAASPRNNARTCRHAYQASCVAPASHNSQSTLSRCDSYVQQIPMRTKRKFCRA